MPRKPTRTAPAAIRQQVAQAIESSGRSVASVARDAKIADQALRDWLAGRIPPGSQSRRRMGDEQLDRLAEVLGRRWELTEE